MSCTLKVPPKKLQDFISLIGKLNLPAMYNRPVQIETRLLQSINGRLAQFCRVLRGARSLAYNLYRSVNHNKYTSYLNHDAVRDLRLVQEILPRWNGNFMWYHIYADKPIEITVDACFEGCGGFVNYAPSEVWKTFPKAAKQGQAFYVRFDKQHQPECKQAQINFGELFIALFSMLLIAPFCENRQIIIHSDNFATVHIINNEHSRDKDCALLCKLFYITTCNFAIDPQLQHIQGSDNVVADAISRDYFNARSKDLRSRLFKYNFTSVNYFSSLYINDLLKSIPWAKNYSV